MKKAISLFLVFSILFLSLFSCSESSQNTGDDAAPTQSSEVVSPAETEPPETELPLPKPTMRVTKCAC